MTDGESATSASPDAARSARRTGAWPTLRSRLWLVALGLLVFAIVTLGLQTVRVEGASMAATLEDGDLVIADSLSYHLHPPSRGDVVIVRDPTQPSRQLVKRVIGVPGDVVAIVPNFRDPSQEPGPAVLVTPAGGSELERLREPYVTAPWTEMTACCDSAGRASATPQPVALPRDQYMILGDDRNVSRDSRSFGLVDRGAVSARALLRIWPLGRLGGLGPGPATAPILALFAPPALPLRLRLSPRRSSRRPPGPRPPARRG